MKPITIENLLAARTADGEGLHDNDLADKAATDAARKLAENWQFACTHDVSIKDLVGDIDDVICMLHAWKKAVLHEFGKPMS